MLVSGKKIPDLDQVKRDFCSSWQAYAHAQQEEITEKRDLRPNSQKVLEYEVSHGAYVLC